MVAARLRTTDLPVEDRFAMWAEMATKAHISTLVDSSHHADFHASLEAHDFGTMTVSTMTHPPLRAWRTPAIVRNEDPDVLLISHVRAGRMILSRDGDELVAPAGSLLVIDTSVPGLVVNDVAVSDTVAHFPTSMLGTGRAQVAALMSRPLSAAGGIGGLVAHVLCDLVRNGGDYDAGTVAQLTDTVIDLVAAAARQATAPLNGTRSAVPERARLLQIYAFIRRNLDDPRLTPEQVALAHGISVRQLNRLLHADGTSPGEWIRRQRLQRCRRELADPSQATRTVAEIGARWGFLDPVGFTRAFRREYAMPPGEYRRRFAGRPGQVP